MSLPGNGIFVVRGEMSTLLTAMRRGSRWNSTTYMDDEKDGLLKLFVDLKNVLNSIEDLRLIDPNVFLAPFLEVIRTDETTGAVTSLGLAAINKFLSYGLIDPTSANINITVENIVDAVTHARFMGTDNSSDGVTLFRVVEVLHTLMRSPEGSALSNETVCEVMLSCFKICFEPRLNEILRRSAEQALRDMVQLLFMRLPQFSEIISDTGLIKKFQMMSTSLDQDKKLRKTTQTSQTSYLQQSSRPRIDNLKNEVRKLSSSSAEDPQSPYALNSVLLKGPPLATTPATPGGNILDMQGKITQTPSTATSIDEKEVKSVLDDLNNTPTSILLYSSKQETNNLIVPPEISIDRASPINENIEQQLDHETLNDSSEYINSVGVRFTHQPSVDGSDSAVSLIPYGLPCIQELFRFLILLCNPLDKQNSDTMIHMGLSLLTVAFEVGADNIGKYEALLELVKDDLCRNLIALMNSERLTIFAADLQLCFLLFESLRGHLKFQLEAYLKKLSEIISSDNPKTPYETREIALDNLLQLWRIPGFVAELYINYDCDLYCSDIFESLTKLLSKYTLSVTNAVYSTHILAMDALISLIENIERNCVVAKNLVSVEGSVGANILGRHSRQNSGLEGIVIDSPLVNESVTGVENISTFLNSNITRLRSAQSEGVSHSIPREQLFEVKHKKRLLTQGTELFNQRPDKGIQYLQENGILNAKLNPMEVALFLRENPGLDKKMIGEYISKKKNVDSKILMNFVDSFDFAGLRVDEALRLYLETFRLPGEAPLIFLVLEHFADHWHKQNGEPFANTDAAFSLAYAIIMLNMDQHNSNAKRLNVPMTQEDFLKNLRGLNGGSDFNQDMLSSVFNAIKNDEIVMPAEQTGLVRENYLWKVLLRRGVTSDGVFNYVDDSSYDLDIFQIIWGASLSALSFMFDKSSENGYQRTLAGFTKCAGITAHYNLYAEFDALILTLCKFTTLLNSAQPEPATINAQNDIVQAVNFGLNQKAQAAMKTVFALVHDYGDCLREGWRSILEVYLQLFRLKLLPKSLMEVEDFCEPNGKVQLIIEKPNQKQEAGLFSSLYSYLSSEGQREPSYEEQEFIKIGKKCIKECQLDQMIQESKFVKLDSLKELLKTILNLIRAPNAHKSVGLAFPEETIVFWMEFLVKIVIHNRDRMIPLWPSVRDQMYLLLMGGASCGYDYLLNRSIVGVLKLAIYLMRNEELCPIVLESLKILLILKPSVILRISKQISIGIYELLKTSAQNIHSEQDWQIVFTILECVGAGAVPPEFDDTVLPVPNGNKSDGALSSEEDSGLPDRGYISDSDLTTKRMKEQEQIPPSNSSSPFVPSSPTTENWILVNKDSDLSTFSRPQSPPSNNLSTISSLIYNCQLIEHSPFALFKCWDSLAFIVRNVAHITPYNFESCVRCIRTFVEACRDGGIPKRRKLEGGAKLISQKKKQAVVKRIDRDNSSQHENEDDDLNQRYETLSIQLLDLMYTLYTRTAQIFRWWAEEGCSVPQCSALWAQGWCPLLQGIARLAMDCRRQVRTYAISCLQQRALLVHDLQTLSGTEWASCFKDVLFPLLSELLPESSSIVNIDVILLEESRIRTATIMSKVFLHHLTPLIELGPQFNELWIEILNFIDKFMKVGSDMLSEQMQEILKNMLLVMHSVRVFHNVDGTLNVFLWDLTWKRIGEFLPNLKEDLFRDEGNEAQVMSLIPAKTTEVINNSPRIKNRDTKSEHKSSAVLIPLCTEVQYTIDSQRPTSILQSAPDFSQGSSLMLDQVSLSKHTPQIIPQHKKHDTHQSPESLPNFQYDLKVFPPLMHQTPMLVQPLPSMSTVQLGKVTIQEDNGFSLPDLVNDASKTVSNVVNSEIKNGIDNSTKLRNEPTPVDSIPKVNHSTYEFSIELPVTPKINLYESEREQFIQIDKEREAYCQHVESDEHKPQQRTDMEHQHLPTLFESDSKPLTYSIFTTESVTASIAEAHALPVSEIKSVPVSHLLVGSQYPSLPKIPNSGIVQSFAPVNIPQSLPGSADIYQEYIQNPYNITLQQQQLSENVSTSDAERQNTSALSPANYFTASVDPTSIPPGSEILFGQP